MDRLKCPKPGDTSYTEDLLLTYRTFLPSPDQLVRRLLSWWDDNATSASPSDLRVLRARIQRCVVLWVHNHPGDFNDRPAMQRFLETFSGLLQRDCGNRRLLYLVLSTRARTRPVSVSLRLVVTPTSCHIILPCVMVGGQGEFGVFVNQAQDQPAIKRGDQVVTLQETSVEGLSLAQLASLLTSLVLTGG